jgi:hypothetical protein
MSTLAGFVVEEVYIYYAAAGVRATDTSGSIRFFIKILLKLLTDTLNYTKPILYPSPSWTSEASYSK